MTEALPLSDDDFRATVRLRTAYGLRADEEFVRRLQEQSGGAWVSEMELLGGIRVAAEEADAANARMLAEGLAGQVEARAVELLGDSYVAVSLEPKSTDVLCTRCEAVDVEAGLDASFPQLADRLDVASVPLGTDELAANVERVGNSLYEARITTNGASGDARTGIATVYSTADGAEAIQAFLDKHPELGPTTLSVDAGTATDLSDKNVALPNFWVEAGQYITRLSSACTSGFAVESYYGPFIMTAGHCHESTGGNAWQQGGLDLGVTAFTQKSGSMDVALIGTYGYRANIGRLHRISTDYAAPITFAITDGHNIVNATFCNSGATTGGMSGDLHPGSRCGSVSSVVYQPPCCGNDGNPYNAAFGLVYNYADAGDSGAAIYWPTIYGYAAGGVLKGGPPATLGYHYFTRMNVAVNSLGLALSAP